MNYKILPITDDLLPIIATWFHDEPWNLPSVEGGLHGAKGYMAVEGEKMLSCLFLYTNGSSYASLDWVCLNPEISIEESEEGLVFLLNSLTSGMSNAGIQCVSFYTRSKLLCSIMDKAGFWQKRNFTQMTKLLRKEMDESHQIPAREAL